MFACSILTRAGAAGVRWAAPPATLTFDGPHVLFRDSTNMNIQRRRVMADMKKEAGRAGARGPAPTGPLHRYRSHTCGALRQGDVGANARLSGWVHRVRDHGGLLFIDLRDHYGLTQVVADPDSPAFKAAETVRSEWVIRVDGTRARPAARARSTPSCRPARSSCSPPRSRCCRRPRSCPSRCSASPTTRRICASIPLPGPAARDAARQHHEAARGHRLDPAAHARGRLLRVPDADPDRLQPRGRARLPGALAHPCRASSTPCRRRRSSTSS